MDKNCTVVLICVNRNISQLRGCAYACAGYCRNVMSLL